MQLLGYYPLSLDVRTEDPLKLEVEWKNKALEGGSYVIIALFTVYDASKDKWLYIVYKHGGITYAWGCYRITVPPSKGETQTDELWTYVCIIPKEDEHRIGIWIYFAPHTVISPVREDKEDYGKGPRVVGLEWSEMYNIIYERNEVIAGKHFPDKLRLVKRPPEEEKPPEERIPLDIIDVRVTIE